MRIGRLNNLICTNLNSLTKWKRHNQNFLSFLLLTRHKSEEERFLDIGDLSSRKALRHRLGCKSFDWFVKNIVPGMLGTDRNPPASGQVWKSLNNFEYPFLVSVPMAPVSIQCWVIMYFLPKIEK